MSLDSPEELLYEADAWRHNRELYPGWLIAPHPVRENLWLRSRDWMAHYLKVRGGLTELQELAVLFELNWRLETALLPVWDDLAPAYEHVITAVNPFPDDLKDLPDAKLVLSDKTARVGDWGAIRQKWLALAFANLRRLREERHLPAFESLHNRLDRVCGMDGDARARWCYERCLFSFADMDEAGARESVERWPTRTIDPFWAVRRAAVLAEMGRTDEAITIAEEALTQIRRNLLDASEHIPGLSREGWAQRLLMSLRWNRDLKGRRTGLSPDTLVEEPADAWRRYRQLAEYNCSPHELSAPFEERLDQPAPLEAPQGLTTPGFHPGTYSRSFHGGDDIGRKLRPAYQYMRLVEEAALPPSVGNVMVADKTLIRAADWFSEYDSVRTQSLMVRLGEQKLVETYLTRHRVAALSGDVVDRLMAEALKSIRWALPRAPVRFRSETDEESRAFDRLRDGIELLSRVCVRMVAGRMAELWNLAHELYRHPAVRIGHGLGRPLRDLFQSLTCSSPAVVVAQQLPGLFGLPLPGEGDFVVAMPDSWPDPVQMPATEGLKGLVSRSAAWKGIAGRLLSQARSDQPDLRQGALGRLVILDSLGVLTGQERRSLGAVFWRQTPPGELLPEATWQHPTPWYALSVYNPRGILPAERVKQHILSRELGAVHGGMVNPEVFFDLVLYATRPAPPLESSPASRHYVEWSPGDLRRLVDIIANWWQVHGRKQAEELREKRPGWFDSPETFLHFVSRLWDVIRAVIIPRVERRSAAAGRVTQLISEARATGLPVGAVLPATLITKTFSLTAVTDQLQQEFTKPDRAFYLSALRGIVFWAEVSSSQRRRGPARIPQPPVDLIRELGATLAFRRPEFLELSLDWAYNVLRCLGTNPDGQFVRSLLVGLDHLSEELTYQDRAGRSAFRYENVPLLRQRSARLAHRLSDCGYNSHPAVLKWRAAADADPLPEVRNTFTAPDH